MVTGGLADALEMLAEIARDGQKETNGLAHALRRGTGNAFWGGILQDMADRIKTSIVGQGHRETEAGNAAEARDYRRDEICSAFLEKAQSMDIEYDFPDLAAAYEKGSVSGPGLDKESREPHDAYVRRCKARGYVPCKHRELIRN